MIWRRKKQKPLEEPDSYYMIWSRKKQKPLSIVTIEEADSYQPKKRKDLKVGAWYKNPKMAEFGVTKALYTKISDIDSEIHDRCNSIIFSEAIMPDGAHIVTRISQSNVAYEELMEEVPDNVIDRFIRNSKFGL